MRVELVASRKSWQASQVAKHFHLQWVVDDCRTNYIEIFLGPGVSVLAPPLFLFEGEEIRLAIYKIRVCSRNTTSRCDVGALCPFSYIPFDEHSCMGGTPCSLSC
jgi:hypothetical protein